MVSWGYFYRKQSFQNANYFQTPNKRFARLSVICSAPGDVFLQVKNTRGKKKKNYHPTKDFMRDLLNIVWSELEETEFQRKDILTKPKFSILKS